MRATNSLSLVAAVFLCVTMIATGEQIVVEVVMKICVESGGKLLSLLGPCEARHYLCRLHRTYQSAVLTKRRHQTLHRDQYVCLSLYQSRDDNKV